jgi:hypothetical protein
MICCAALRLGDGTVRRIGMPAAASPREDITKTLVRKAARQNV